jgi:hypothetical protein
MAVNTGAQAMAVRWPEIPPALALAPPKAPSPAAASRKPGTGHQGISAL